MNPGPGAAPPPQPGHTHAPHAPTAAGAAHQHMVAPSGTVPDRLHDARAKLQAQEVWDAEPDTPAETAPAEAKTDAH